MFLLVQRFGELMRKLWNPRNFKAHVSPHEMLQAVVLCSKKNFQITKQGNAVLYIMFIMVYITYMSTLSAGYHCCPAIVTLSSSHCTVCKLSFTSPVLIHVINNEI